MRTEALRLYQESYPDYGPTLFAEMLSEHHDLVIDSDTLRRWLKASGLWIGIRAARRHRQRRERREAIGALVQFDGSAHAWLEDRMQRLHLKNREQVISFALRSGLVH